MLTRKSLLGSSSSSIKLHNLRAILLTLLRHETVSRVRIAALTGLSTTTVTNLIAELLAQGIVAEEGNEQPEQPQRGVGRPRTALRLVPHARYALGVHIGVGRVTVAVTDLFARPVCTFALEHALDRPAEEVLAGAADLVEQAITCSGIDPALIVGAGVGASGLVDPYTGVNVLAPNLGWRDVPIRAWLSRRIGLPVFVDNNVRAMALAEALFGAAQDVYVLAFVYVRIGVGAGFVVGGQLYRGGAGAGEIGHVTIMADDGEPCRCGNVGCLETLISEPAIIRLAQAIRQREPDGILTHEWQDDDRPPLERIFSAARLGDSATRAMLETRAHYMGIGLANLINTLSPELIILGGIFAEGQDLLLPTVTETLRQRAFANLGEQVRLQVPTFGHETGVIGAAALALDAFFYEQSEVM
jgi:predicted NBD/HSP70 family sugar kinase